MKLILLAAVASIAAAQTPEIDRIMSRVALNQAKSHDARKDYVYNQKQLLRMIRGGGRIAREEHREYTVTPTHRGILKELTKFDGKYEQKGRFIAYDKPGYHYKGLDLDSDLIDSLSKDLMDDNQGKDGLSPDMFPLTYHQQLKYDFKLLKTEQYRGRPVYRVRFEPKVKPALKQLEGGAVWKGEALIDAGEYQPLNISTRLAWKMPLAVKTLLGTNVSGVGFNVSYQKFADGLWFPVSYGGEFEFRAVFFYKRTMTISMANSEFRRADVNSSIAYAVEDK
jgi:hypothetical protein